MRLAFYAALGNTVVAKDLEQVDSFFPRFLMPFILPFFVNAEKEKGHVAGPLLIISKSMLTWHVVVVCEFIYIVSASRWKDGQ